jgi:hypothetical protein
MTLLLDEIRARINDVPVFPISNLTQSGYSQHEGNTFPGKTYCVLGSSVWANPHLLIICRGGNFKDKRISELTKKGGIQRTGGNFIYNKTGVFWLTLPRNEGGGDCRCGGDLRSLSEKFSVRGRNAGSAIAGIYMRKECAVLKAG